MANKTNLVVVTVDGVSYNIPKTSLSALKGYLAVVGATETVVADGSVSSKTSKKSSNGQQKSSKVATSVDIADYKPSEWGGAKGKGYTALRKAYSYACCKAEGKDYDEAIFKKASEDYRKKYYDTLA